jgi:hypothetical protein
VTLQIEALPDWYHRLDKRHYRPNERKGTSDYNNNVSRDGKSSRLPMSRLLIYSIPNTGTVIIDKQLPRTRAKLHVKEDPSFQIKRHVLYLTRTGALK